MGKLIKGIWQENDEVAIIKDDSFVRPESSFRHRITEDGSNGFKAESDRYHLYVSCACPWA